MPGPAHGDVQFRRLPAACGSAHGGGEQGEGWECDSGEVQPGRGQDTRIFNAGYPTPVPYACEAGALVDAIETTVSASRSFLSYDAAADQYTYTWKTDKAWAGKCVELHLGLKDGQTGTRSSSSPSD